MRRGEMRVIGLVISASMVLGLVPTPALAEMAERAAGPLEQRVEDVDGTADGARDDGAAASDGAASAGEGAADAAQTADEAVAERADGTVPDAAAEARKTPEEHLVTMSEDDAADEDGGGAGLPSLELDTPLSVSVGGDVPWVGSFTAPEDGVYAFSSACNNDPDAYLYADAECAYQLAYDDDNGPGMNFLLTHYLAKGQTAYLKIPEWRGAMTLELTVSRSYDIGAWNWSLSPSALPYTGAPVEPPTLTLSLGTGEGTVSLEQGTDFRLDCCLDVYGMRLGAGDLREPGRYYAVYQGIEPYTGTIVAEFSIANLRDISNDSYWSTWFSGDSYITYTGKPVELSPLTIRHYGDEEVTLVQDTDFRLSGYQDARRRALGSAPSEVGRYYAVYKGIEPYMGTVTQEFRITGDASDLSAGRLRLWEYTYDHTGSPVTPSSYAVYDVNGSWVDSSHYDLVYYDEDGTELAGAPSDIGSYLLAARAGVGDSRYTGETARVGFDIGGSDNIGNHSYFSSWFYDSSDIGYTGRPVVLPALRLSASRASTMLVEGTDFELASFADEDGLPLNDGEWPTEIGSYYAVYRGKGSYKGRLWESFRIVDPHDLSSARVRVESEELLLTDADPMTGTVSPMVTVTDLAGTTLMEGRDYRLVYRREGGMPIAALTEAGTYEMTIVGSGDYAGSDRGGGMVYVYDPADIGSDYWRAEFQPSNEVPLAGTSAELPAPLIYRYGKNYAQIRLKEGVDFELARIVGPDGAEVEAITGLGDYLVEYRGIDSHRGKRAMSLHVYDPHDISSPYWDSSFVGGSTLHTAGGRVLLGRLRLYNGASGTSLTEGTDFRLLRVEDTGGNKADLQKGLENGSYYAVYEGIEPYTGTRFVWFEVSDSNDLANAHIRLAESSLVSTGGSAAPTVLVRDADGILLREGEQYELVFCDSNWNELSAAPTAPGDYHVEARALEGTRYVGQTAWEDFTIGKAAPEEPSKPTFAPLKLGEPTAIPGVDGTTWLASFTAPEMGRYVFEFDDAMDLYPYLYEDPYLNSQLSYRRYGAGGPGYRLACMLATGQTAYLRAYRYGNATGTKVTVSRLDERSLACADVSIESSNVVLAGATAEPVITVTDAGGQPLTRGTDYELAYYLWGEGGFEPIDALPSKPGSYQVVARAKEGGAYTGESAASSFWVYDAHDLTAATISFEDYYQAYTGRPVELSATVTDAAGKALAQGTDYELVYFQIAADGTEELGSTPAAVGSYRVAARGRGAYEGTTSTRSFAIYDPRDLAAATVTLDDPAYYESYGSTSVPVYLLEGKAARPGVSVRARGVLLGDSDYDVSYQDNTTAGTDGRLASMTVTGKGAYHGSQELMFRVVDRIDLAECFADRGCTVTVGAAAEFVSSYGSGPQFMTDGWAIAPLVSFTPSALGVGPVQGRDFTVSFADADGAPIDAPAKEGAYRLVLTATEGGNSTGELEIPFSLVDSRDLTYRRATPDLRSGFSAYSSHSAYANYYELDDEVAADGAGDFVWGLAEGGRTLVENLDYVVSSVFDSVRKLFTFVFTGIGEFAETGLDGTHRYDGSVRAKVYVAESPQQSFEGRTCLINRSVANAVYAGAGGSLETPLISIDGLTAGVDFAFDSFYDAYGKPVSSAKAGETVYVLVKGLGTYQDSSRLVSARVYDGSSKYDLSSGYVSMALENGAYDYRSGAWYLLRGVEPSVALTVYGRVYTRSYLTLDGSRGYSVESSVSGSAMSLAVEADEDSPVIRGSRKAEVTLVDSYSLTDLCDRLELEDPNGASRTYVIASSADVFLSYAGVPYTPTFTLRQGYRVVPAQVSAELRRSSGAVVDEIDGPGAYTLTITGTGGWSGTVEVPIEVVKAADQADLARCEMMVGPATLADGAARPAVTLTYGGRPLTEETDYTLEYGSNTEAGVRGWVKATAVEGGSFRGFNAANFTVTDDESPLRLNVGTYELRLELPSKEGYAAADVLRAYELPAGATEGPDVQVVRRDTGEIVSPERYVVSYDHVGGPGIGSVTVTGTGGNGGSLSANFIVVNDARGTSIADAMVTVAEGHYVYTGEALEPAVTVMLGDDELVAGTDYTVEYRANVNAGEATVIVTGRDAYKGTATGRFEIAKATPAVTAPTALSLAYDGTAQELVAAGATTGGALLYALSEDGAWSASVPAAADAGSYEVWYRVEGGTNFESTKPLAVEAPIAKRELTVTARDQAVTYGTAIAEGIEQVEVTGLAEGQALTSVALAADGTGVGAWAIMPSVARIAGAGLADVTDNYQISYAKGTLTVAAAPSVVTAAPSAVASLEYTGSPRALVTAGAAEGGTLEYRLGEGGAWGTAVPEATDAGDYEVWYRVIGDANHEGVAESGPVAVSVAKATPAVTAPTALSLAYDGTAQELVAAGATTGGALLYALSEDGAWSASVPAAADAGSYEVWYRVEGGKNYEDVVAKSVAVSVARRALTVTARDQAVTYGAGIGSGIAQVSAEGLANGHALTSVTLMPSRADAGEGAITPSAAKVGADGTDVTANYDVAYVDGKLSIAKAAPQVSAPVAVPSLAYTGEAQGLITPGLVEGGTLFYALAKDGEFSQDVPEASGAGAYDVWWRVKGDANHEDVEVETPVRANIAKVADPAVVTRTATVARGGNKVDLAGNVAGNVGALSFAIKGAAAGCELTEEGLLTSGLATGTVTVTVTIAPSANHFGRSEDMAVMVTEKAVAQLPVSQRGTTYGDVLAEPSYEAPAVSGTVAASYAGRLWDGSAYGPAAEPPTEAGSYVVTVSYETADTVHTGSAAFEIARASVASAEVAGAEDLTYTGSALEHEALSVSVGATVLVQGRDFTLTYAANTDAGDASVTVKGRGNYEGELTVGFRVLPASIAGAAASVADGSVYTGSALEPAVTVSLGAKVLIPGTDYDLEYSDNVDAGDKAIVTVEGRGNYAGTLERRFAIAPAALEIAMVSDIEDQTWTGKGLEPKPEVTFGGRTLVRGRDYELAWEDNVAAPGTGRVTVSGRGNFAGSVKRSFAIVPVYVEDVELTLAQGSAESPLTAPMAALVIDAKVTAEGGVPHATDESLVWASSNEEAATVTPVEGGAVVRAHDVPDERVVTITATAADRGSVKGTFELTVRIPKSLAVLSPAGADGHPAAELSVTDAGGGRLDGDKVDPKTEVHVSASPRPGYRFRDWHFYKREGGKLVDVTGSIGYRTEPSGPRPQASAGRLRVAESDAQETDGGGQEVQQAWFDMPTYPVSVTARFISLENPIPLASCTAELSGEAFVYDGREQLPSVTLTDPNGFTLEKDTDYTVEFPEDSTSAGPKQLTLTAVKGSGYDKTLVCDYRIEARDIADASVASIPAQTYTGKAVTPRPKVTLSGTALVEGVDYELSWANNVNPGTATVTVTGIGNYTGTARRTFSIAAPRVSYRTHVQNVGWQGWVADGKTAGTSGRGLRLEGAEIKLGGAEGGIQYRTHIQNVGWQGWKRDGQMSGTSGRGLRLEAIQIKLTGSVARDYDVWYRVHAQNVGWMGWAKNGAMAGTASFGWRLEAIQIKLVAKGGKAPGTTSAAFRNAAGAVSGMPDSESAVLYRTHVQNVGWQNWMRDGETSGTSGRGLRLEAINLKLGGALSGGIRYRTHIQNIGWQAWKSNGGLSGTSGRGLRLEAIQIELTGGVARDYDVWYRVHAQNVGWMGWAKNGAMAGTHGRGWRLEAIQVKLVPKGGKAPGPTTRPYL